MPPNVKARLADVTDGMSHTILLAESQARLHLNLRGKKVTNDLKTVRVNGGGWSPNANEIRLLFFNRTAHRMIEVCSRRKA